MTCCAVLPAGSGEQQAFQGGDWMGGGATTGTRAMLDCIKARGHGARLVDGACGGLGCRHSGRATRHPCAPHDVIRHCNSYCSDHLVPTLWAHGAGAVHIMRMWLRWAAGGAATAATVADHVPMSECPRIRAPYASYYTTGTTQRDGPTNPARPPKHTRHITATTCLTGQQADAALGALSSSSSCSTGTQGIHGMRL